MAVGSYDIGEIKTALADISAHEIFATSPKTLLLLNYIVNATIDGRQSEINETKIAQDVFKKGADFNSATDSLVRVSAGRVRNMLVLYYATIKNPSLIISIPTGRYIAKFERPNSAMNANKGISKLGNIFVYLKNRSQIVSIFSALMVCLFVLIATVMISRNQVSTVINENSGTELALKNPSQQTTLLPKIAIPSFINKSGDAKFDFLENALQWKLVDDLARFEIVRPSAFDGNLETLLTAQPEDFDYAISAIILAVEPELDLYVKLINIETGATTLERRIMHEASNTEYYEGLKQIIHDLSGNFMDELSTQRLAIIQNQIQNDLANIENHQAFECMLLAYELQGKPDAKLYRYTYNCLQDLIQQFPDNSSILAHFGILKMIGAKSHESFYQAKSVDPNMSEEDGLKLLERAVEIAPNSSLANHLMAEGYKFVDEPAKALKHAELAYIANPGDPDILISLAARLATLEEFDRAEELARIAIARDPDNKEFLFRISYLRSLSARDHIGMKAQVKNLESINFKHLYLFEFISAYLSDDKEKASALKPRVIETAAKQGNVERMIQFVVLYSHGEMYNEVSDIFYEAGVTPKLSLKDNLAADINK